MNKKQRTQTSQIQREERMAEAQERIRLICAERGLDWDTMSEEEREIFVDDWLHEE